MVGWGCGKYRLPWVTRRREALRDVADPNTEKGGLRQ